MKQNKSQSDMKQYINAMRIFAALAIPGKAISTCIQISTDGGDALSVILSGIYMLILLTIGYFSLEYGIRLFIYPNILQLVNTFSKQNNPQNITNEATPAIPLIDPVTIENVVEYALGTFDKVFTPGELKNLEACIRDFANGKTGMNPSIERRISNFRTLDVFHFGWNIGKRLRKSNIETASFLKSQFPIQLIESSEETVSKKLSSDDGSFLIPKIPIHLPLKPFPLAAKLGLC